MASSTSDPLAWPAAHWTARGLQRDAFKAVLRPLPLPLLDDTLRSYLISVKPLLSKEEYAATEELVRKFGTSSSDAGGPALQRALDLRARKGAAAGAHWLEEWWEHFAYLSCRAPLPVKWNIFATMFSVAPTDLLHQRAALLLSASAEFYLHTRAGRIAPDVLDTRGTIPLCMWQYERLFASSRVPLSEARDEIVTAKASRHVVVFCDGHAYAVQVLTEPDDALVAPADIERALIAIDQDAKRRGPNPHPLMRSRYAARRVGTPPRGVHPRALPRGEYALARAYRGRSCRSHPRPVVAAEQAGAVPRNT